MSELSPEPSQAPADPETDKSEVVVTHLSGDEDLTQAFSVRRAVFHEEQGISEDDDFDGQDTQADHFLAFDGEKPVGTARVRYVDGKAKVERVAVLGSYRGRGIGESIMHNILEFIKQKGIEE